MNCKTRVGRQVKVGLVGYMRVSSDSDRQTTDLQRDALLSAGVDSRHLTNLAAGDTSVGSTPGCSVLDDLRHRYATFALRQGESVLAIGRLLGHANPETTLRYIHLCGLAAQGTPVSRKRVARVMREAGLARVIHRPLTPRILVLPKW